MDDGILIQRMRVLLAFDKFKDALSADEACAAAGAALSEVHPEWELDFCPLTDGGEGFARLLTRAAGGTMRTARATGPLGQPVTADYGLVPLHAIAEPARERLGVAAFSEPTAMLAVVEMAAVSGLALVPRELRNPWEATSFGTGELIAAAAAENPVALVLGVGGSATNDLGLGALAALGLRGDPPPSAPFPVPAAWRALERFTGTLRTGLPPLHVACDVTNPLLGPRGCVAVFAGQKGLRREDAPRLEQETKRVAGLLSRHFRRGDDALADTPGAGAAGGIAFGLMTALGARLVSGSALVAEWLGLDRRIAAADLVLTGEGAFDDSSLGGKGAGAILARAIAHGRTAHVFAGSVAASLRDRPQLHAITPAGLPLASALPATARLLRAAVRRLFR